MKSDPKHTLYHKYLEIHDNTQSLLEQGDNIEDKGGKNHFFGMIKYENKLYIIAGDDIGFSERDRNNFIFPDRVHTEGTTQTGENGKFNSGGIASNIFLSNDKIPIEMIRGKGLYKNQVLNSNKYPYKSLLITQQPSNGKIYTLDCDWNKYFTDETDDYKIDWEELNNDEYKKLFDSCKEILTEKMNIKTLFVYPKDYSSEIDIMRDLEEVKSMYSLYYYPRITGGFNCYFINQNNIEKIISLDICKELCIADKEYSVDKNNYKGDIANLYFEGMKNNINFNIKIKEEESSFNIDIYKKNEAEASTFNRNKKSSSGKGFPNIKEIARDSIINEDFSIDVVFKNPTELIEFNNQMVNCNIDQKDAKVFIRRGTRLIGVPKTVNFITNMTGVYNKHLHFIINFPLNTNINLKLHGNKFLFEYHTLDEDIKNIIASSVKKCCQILKLQLEKSVGENYEQSEDTQEDTQEDDIQSDVQQSDTQEDDIQSGEQPEEEQSEDTQGDDIQQSEDIQGDEQSEDIQGDEQSEDTQGDDIQQSGEQSEEEQSGENSEQSSPNGRRNFSDITKRLALERQPYCPLLGTKNTFKDGVNIFDYDHLDNNNSNYLEDNCNPLSLIAHRIKTKSPGKYDEYVSDSEKLKQFRKDNLIECIIGLKRDNMLDDNIKNDICRILYQAN